MQEKVLKIGIQRQAGYLYFWDAAKGVVFRIKMGPSGRPKEGVPEEVAKAEIPREEGYLYFVDTDGDLSRILVAS